VSGDSPIRDLSNLLCIAEVRRRFDVIAVVQEVRRRAQVFPAMLQVPGEDGRCWSHISRGRQGTATGSGGAADHRHFYRSARTRPACRT